MFWAIVLQYIYKINDVSFDEYVYLIGCFVDSANKDNSGFSYMSPSHRIEYKKSPSEIYRTTDPEIFTLYNYYKDGFLPDKGSILDQPNKHIESFNIINNLVMEWEKEERKRGERKHKSRH